MCGIAGILQIDPNSYNKEHLKKMTDALSHRGPDGEGFWQNNSNHVLFGHRRLSILDLTDAAAQPFHYLDRYTILHNGEIYNYIELREELKEKVINSARKLIPRFWSLLMIAGKKIASNNLMACLLSPSGMKKKRNSLLQGTALERSLLLYL